MLRFVVKATWSAFPSHMSSEERQFRPRMEVATTICRWEVGVGSIVRLNEYGYADGGFMDEVEVVE